MTAKKKKIWRWLIPLVLVAAAAAALLTKPDKAVKYAQTEAYTGDIATEYSFTGVVNAPHSQTLTAGSASTVKEVYVSANQNVRSGDRILRLANGELLKADIAGELVTLSVRKDDAVSPGMTLATIMDVSRLEARISVDEYDAPAVLMGNELNVTVNATGNTCKGVVTAIDKNASVTGELSTYYVTAELEHSEGALPGMQVEAVMVKESAQGVTLVAAEALGFDAHGRAYVLTGGENGYTETYVETGINNGAEVEIKSGIQAGTAVFYTPKGVNDMMLMFMSQRGGASR